MTKEQKEDILSYIKRSIPDIARKCRVSQDEVILVMSEVIPCELKQCETSTHEDEYVIVQWPEIQELMTEEDFRENSCLLNEEPMLSEYGSSAYFVNSAWLKRVYKQRYDEEQADAFLSTIEAHEQM